MNFKSNLVFLAIAFIFSACTKTESISISGSSTVLPVVSIAAEQFKTQYPDKNVIVNAGGSGVGVNQVGRGEVEIGMASRDITQTERASFPDSKLIQTSIGKDAVVPAVSSEIYQAGVTALTLEQIGKIYTGEIQNWQEVGGPDIDILVIDKEKSRGTRHVFMQHVLGDKDAEANGADLVLGSNNEEQTAMVQSNSAIGMLSNAWLNDDVIGLSIVTSSGKSIEPNLANILSGEFPITRDLYLITNGQPKGDTKAFIDFVLGVKGQEIVSGAGYLSLSQ